MTRYAAILLSRQPLRPTRNTPWVRRAVEAVGWLGRQGRGIIASTGMQTWELITSLTSDLNLPLKLCLPSASDSEFDRHCAAVAEDFGLSVNRTEFLPVPADGGADRAGVMLRRDRMVIDRADLLLPVSIRNGGHMAALIAEAERAGRPVERRFQTDHVLRGTPLKLIVDKDALAGGGLPVENNRVIHWTRAVSHPWPGERRLDFYRSILKAERWPRSGFDTLQRIVRLGTLLASGRNMPGNIPTVAFSELPPRDLIPLMRWRARRGEMSFEPYGIGIARSAAESVGVRPVRYFRREDKPEITDGERWRWQSIGRLTDWRAEREYRHLGDLALDRLPPEAIELICMTAREAESLRARYPYRIYSFLP